MKLSSPNFISHSSGEKTITLMAIVYNSTLEKDISFSNEKVAIFNT